MSSFVSKVFVWCLFLCSAEIGAAQTKLIPLRLTPGSESSFWANIKGFTPIPKETEGALLVFPLDTFASIDSFHLRLVHHFRQKAFLLASIDAVAPSDTLVWGDSTIPTLNLGPEMRWVSLRFGSGLEQDNRRAFADFNPKPLLQKPFRHEALLSLEQKILEQAENNGYPFASVWLDSIEVHETGSVSAVLQLDKNRFFIVKTLKINGDARLPKTFLSNYLGIKPGAPYSRARVLRIREQLRSLVFLESNANPIVTFSTERSKAENLQQLAPGEATINLFLQKKRASRFDFLLGLLPQPDNENGKLLLTGSLSAAFQNALNLGERFSVELERLRPETQKMDVQASVPYILGSTFGAEARLGIFRRDSTWTDAQSELGVSYLFVGANFVRFFWENKSSALQKVDTLSVLNSRQLPANLDFRQNGFGVESNFSRLDYRFNPRKGWSLSLKTAAGFNTVRRNTQIENLIDPNDPNYSFSSLYDSIAGKAARYRAEIRGELFIPIFTRSTVKIGLRGGGIFSEKQIFANESYRLGGNKLLRGFDEESLLATRFLVSTAEWRLLIGPNSFLAAFADWGYLENLAAKNRIFLRPLGLGFGLNFETRAGIFGISAAVGRRDVGQSVDFRATKFHLGYVSLF